MIHDREAEAPSAGLLRKNRRWLRVLEEGMAGLPPAEQAALMAAPGRACAEDVWRLCEACLGRPLVGLDDLIQGWNMLRRRLDLDGSWTLVGGRAHGLFSQCGCPLIRSRLLALTPARCHCTKAMMESIFARAAGGPVRVELARTIARGDEVCEFRIAGG